jgi:DNA-binding protein Fis
MSGFQSPGDIWKPLHDQINKATGNQLQTFNGLLQEMLDHDCINDTDTELSDKLMEIVESNQLHIAGAMAVMEAAMRLRGNRHELLIATKEEEDEFNLPF